MRCNLWIVNGSLRTISEYDPYEMTNRIINNNNNNNNNTNNNNNNNNNNYNYNNLLTVFLHGLHPSY